LAFVCGRRISCSGIRRMEICEERTRCCWLTKSLHTTPDGAFSSAFAVHVISPACVSSIVRPHDMLMTKTTSHSSAMRTLAWISLCLLIPAGFGFLYSALIGDSHGLKAWLLPFAPWLCTLPAFRRLRQKQD
jgi:hypothetical protein